MATVMGQSRTRLDDRQVNFMVGRRDSVPCSQTSLDLRARASACMVVTNPRSSVARPLRRRLRYQLIGRPRKMEWKITSTRLQHFYTQGALWSDRVSEECDSVRSRCVAFKLRLLCSRVLIFILCQFFCLLSTPPFSLPSLSIVSAKNARRLAYCQKDGMPQDASCIYFCHG